MMMRSLLFLYFIHLVNSYSLEPSCSSCKFFLPNSINPDLGLCTMFQEKIYDNNKNEYIVNNLAIYCRGNEKLCGKNGYLYKSIDRDLKISENSIQKLEIEKLELKKLDKELISIFQKMKKHNTKRIYKNKSK